MDYELDRVSKNKVSRGEDTGIKDRLQVCLPSMSFECSNSYPNMHPAT